MRTALVLFSLVLLPAHAEPGAVRDRLPEGAVAYVETNGLGGKVAAIVASPLGKSVAAHPAVQAFWNSPEGLKLQMGRMFLRGATGRDLAGVLEAVAGRRIGVALYAEKKLALVAQVDADVVNRLLKAVEAQSGAARQVVVPADERGPALWRLGAAYGGTDGDVFFVATDRALAERIRLKEGVGLKGAALEAACARVGDADVFGFVDLEPFRAMLLSGGKPKNLGQAFFLGAFAHAVPQAPWAGFGLSLEPRGDAWRLRAQGVVPAPREADEAVVKSFGGTLEPLPFKLPAETIGVVRLKRDLGALWEHRDALVAERGLAGLVEFETNFANLTYMSFVEEFLPNVGGELVLLGTRRAWKPGAPAPAVKLPQGALLWPVKDGGRFAEKLQLSFNNLVAILNLQAAQQGGNPLLLQSSDYGGTMIHTSRYLPPKEGEMEGREKLPLRYNFTPSVAIVGDYLVLASTSDLLKQLVDAHGAGAVPVPENTNGGVWLEPATLRAALADNREPLIANAMLKEGDTRAQAENKIDLALDLGRFVRNLSITAEESRASLAATLEAVFGPTEE